MRNGLSFLWSRQFRALVAIFVVPLLSAGCADAPSAPQMDAPKLRRAFICVQTDENGAIVATKQPDAAGGCGYGFDLHVWG